MKIKNSDNYASADLNVASTLVALGYKLIDLDRTNPKRILFCFKRDTAIEKIVEGYWTDNLALSPQKLFDTQRQLKNRIYSDV
jgi:hypothetical protein